MGSRGEGEELLCSLVESKAIGPAIKAVFDRGWQDKYADLLMHNIQKKDQTIRGVCNENYQEFISAIDSVITVKLDIQELKKEIVDLNKQVQQSGEKLVQESTELMKWRNVRKNLNGSIELLRNCQYLMSLVAKAKQQVDDQKYFLALKTLDQLQRLHLPKFADHGFAQHLEKQIPLMIRSVKDSATNEFETWLAAIREKSKRLGAFALTQMKAKVSLEAKGGENDDIATVDEQLDGASLFEKFEVNFGSVYQCLHIYENLHIDDEFHRLYKDKRKNQSETACELRNMTPKEFEGYYETYFAQLTGFFIVEDAVMKSGNGGGLLQRTDLESMWEHVVQSIKAVLHKHLASITELDLLLQVQQTVVTFCSTLAIYGMNVDPLHDFLYNERSKFEALLHAKLSKDITVILESERFEPLYLPTIAEYEQQVLAYELQDPSVNIDFPATMPFSKIVPQLCQAMQCYISLYHKYARNLQHMGEAIEKGVDVELMEVNKYINTILNKESQLHLSQVVQLSINSSFLSTACAWIHKATAYNNNQPSSLSLPAASMFLQTEGRCEDLVFELVSAKIDQFLSLAANFNWLPGGCCTQPSEYVVDCVTYLEIAFATMTSMSDPKREAIHFFACKHISSFLLEQLVATKKFNIIAIYNLNVDLKELENFATRCYIPALSSVFTELRQFIDLLLHTEFEHICDPQIKQNKFSHLSSEKLHKLMAKYKDIGLFGSLPPGVRNLKKKDVDLALKRLKQT